MSEVVLLETERLLLRAFTLHDLDGFAAIRADALTMRFLGGVRSRDDAWRDIAITLGHWSLNGFGMWAVEEKASGTFVGRVGLVKPPGWSDVEVGWAIARAYWGRGVAPEAARAALAWGFAKCGFEYVVVSLIQADNAPSIRVAEKIGETLEGPIEFMGTQLGCYGIGRPD